MEKPMEKFLDNNPMYNNVSKSVKNNTTVHILLFVLLGILFLLLSYFIKDKEIQNFFSFFIENKNIFDYISNGLLTLGTIIISSAIIDFLHSTNAFSKIILNEFKKALVDKEFIESYNDQEINKLVQKIQDTHSYIKIENLKIIEESIFLAKEATLRLINEAKLSKDDDQNILRRANQNYYVRKSNQIRTIMRNGSEISTYELDIEIIENGTFAFFYQFSSSNTDTKFPPFNDFLDNKDERFSKNSFCADLLEYKRNGNFRNCQNCLNIETIKDDEQEKEIVLFITDCYKGDKLKLSFSLTVKNEINKHSIQKQKDNIIKNILPTELDKIDTDEPYSEMKQQKVHGFTSRNPIGVRKVKVQQERYGDHADSMELSPSIKVGESQVMPEKESKNIYYDTVEWTIYYKEYSDSKVVFSLL